MRIGFVCDLRDHDNPGKVYMLVNDQPKGLLYTVAKRSELLYPVVSLACSENVIKINNDAKFPTCEWDLAQDQTYV
jgi:hypothetical protein